MNGTAAVCARHFWTSISAVDVIASGMTNRRLGWMCLHCRSYSTFDPRGGIYGPIDSDPRAIDHLEQSPETGWFPHDA